MSEFWVGVLVGFWLTAFAFIAGMLVLAYLTVRWDLSRRMA